MDDDPSRGELTLAAVNRQPHRTQSSTRVLYPTAILAAMSLNAYRPRRPSAFLSLVPNTSEARVQEKQPLTADALAELPKKEETASEAAKRRTSSLSSDGSKAGFRFLRLQDTEKKGDFFEVAVE
ncbi:hypothetical protein B0T16DRAFT_453030 [Cercophora newfieldiana]|uniref:Uncharacterized protein n=1 Tax=Cercophora newfieldiana TaxID=92897 RepID=A0AA40D293_9PEZI|nr:hypothetical protein B0T16DRAFT_453030 [Cercophora newfieldiana]